MAAMGDLQRTWKVGELARATGLTIRALHHYDEIGLLVPGRTESGHRVYSPAEVERLYRVLALRGVGLALDEIAAVLDDAEVSLADTVRRHVAAVERDIEQRRRLLERLREMLDALERSPARPVDELLGAVEAMSVVEATIEDVVTREPWLDAYEMTAPCVVLLREHGGDRVLPIWIGEPEAAALVVQRQGIPLARPMSPDLTVALLGAVAARVERVVVERLEDSTFFATVIVSANGEPREVDARPSDALNIALRVGAPIHVAAQIMDSSGIVTWPGEKQGDPAAPPWAPLEPGRPSRRIAPPSVGEHSPDVVRRAGEEATRLGHGIVGSAHLLLGILAQGDSPATRLLTRHGVTLQAARETVAAMFVQTDTRMPPPGEKTFLTPHATLAVSRARQAALRSGVDDIDPLQVLLALIDNSGAVAVLDDARVDVPALRAELAG